MGLKMSSWKGKFMKKYRGVITMMIRRYKGQWILLGNFRQILDFISYHGRPVKSLTIAVVVEKKIFVCLSVTLCLGGNPMISESWCWFKTLQKELR